MKKLLPLLFLGLLLGCQSTGTSEETSETTENAEVVEEAPQPVAIVGKTIEYRYGESVYHVMVDTDSTMHWEAMAGDEKGVKANENYKMHRLDPETIFITWGEENGIGVSQVLDFKNGIVYNHLLRDRDISIGKGEIKILE